MADDTEDSEDTGDGDDTMDADDTEVVDFSGFAQGGGDEEEDELGGEVMELRYHKELFDRLDIEPILSPENVARIAEREHACGATFPAAVKELLSIDDICDIFREHTNEDGLVSNNAYSDEQMVEELGDPEETAQGYLRVAVENQGVVAWYVKLDGTDDPAVFHNNDDWDSPLDEVEWVHCTDTFSEFVRDMMRGE